MQYSSIRVRTGVILAFVFGLSAILFFPLSFNDRIVFLFLHSCMSSVTSIGALYYSDLAARKIFEAKAQAHATIKELNPQMEALWPKLQAGLEWYAGLPDQRKQDFKRGVGMALDIVESKLTRLAARNGSPSQ